jgi:superoxide reductase
MHCANVLGAWCAVLGLNPFLGITLFLYPAPSTFHLAPLYLSVPICVFFKRVVINMAELKDLFQSADWKKEKHVPVIDVSDKVKKGELIKVTVSVGKEITHPNTTEHHIRWIEVYFLPDGEKFPYQISRCEFAAHGESTQGPNTSSISTHPETTFSFKSDKSGTIFASSYCNIHGIWQNVQKVSVVS